MSASQDCDLMSRGAASWQPYHRQEIKYSDLILIIPSHLSCMLPIGQIQLEYKRVREAVNAIPIG